MKSILGVVFLPLLLPCTLVFAQNLSSPNYHLELGNVSFDEPTSGPAGPLELTLPKAKPEEPKELYDDKGYFAKDGFSYLTQDQAFSLSQETYPSP